MLKVSPGERRAVEQELGGIAPHISKRDGAKQVPSADIGALPPERRERLVRNTVAQDRRRRSKRGRGG